MKKISFSILLALFITFLQGQVAPDKYFVRFTDKNNSPYSIENPSEYLSQRAIDRRERQNIPIDERDLPVNPSYLQGVQATGAVLQNPTKWLNGVTIFTTDLAVLEAIESLPYVAGITKSSPIPEGGNEFVTGSEKPFFSHETYDRIPAGNIKNGKQLGTFDYGMSFNQIEMLNGNILHEMGYRGQGMVIAILDGGFLNANALPVFDSLWNNNQILGTRDFVSGGPVSFSGHPHGSMVLSCMGGNYPGELIGTAPKASYWLLLSEDTGSEYIIEEYNWVSAAEYADSVGADVINSSLGYTEFNDPLQNHIYSELDGDTAPATIGADVAAQKGILVVNSLGNEGSSPWYYLSVPSDGDSVMGIGAVDGSGNYAGFSSHGPSYDGRVKPNVVAQGSGVYIADPYSFGFTFGGGTSFSSPILAGMAACLWQANPALNNMQIARGIEQSASQYLTPDDFLGYGIPDFVEALDILTIIGYDYASRVNVTVSPNPFNNEVRISFPDQAAQNISRISLVDITGRVLVTNQPGAGETSAQYLLRLPENLDRGVYILTVETAAGTGNVKLIKE